MWRKKLCVPLGTLAQLIAGDVPSPAATPGAALTEFNWNLGRRREIPE